ncbi:MAG: hypothetical protein QM753_00160 [Thermomicrobiales bacterium]
MEAVVLLVVAVVVVNLAFVIVPARDLRVLLAPPRPQRPAAALTDEVPSGADEPIAPPVASRASASWPVRGSAKSPSRPQGRHQSIVLRSAMPAIVSPIVAGLGD